MDILDLSDANQEATTKCCEKQTSDYHSTGSHCLADCIAVIVISNIDFSMIRQVSIAVAAGLIGLDKYHYLFRPPIV